MRRTYWLVPSLPALIWALSLPANAQSVPFAGQGDSFLNRLAASGGNQWAQGQMQGQAVAQGMKDLVEIMQTNGHDPQRAMMTYLQTPRGQQVANIPGALPALIQNFNAMMALPSARR